MKKLCGILIFCLCATIAFAEDPNHIEMVTYFPVPYTSYESLDVMGRCDVGLLHTCSLQVGGDLAIDRGPFLQAGSDTTLENPYQHTTWATSKLTLSSGKLSLGAVLPSSAIYATKVLVGNSNGTKTAFKFSHPVSINGTITHNGMTLKTLADPTTGTGGTATVTELHLKRYSSNLYAKFPSCTSGTKKIKWQRLTVGTASGVFLICGE